MARVNEALAAIGDDEVSGFRLLREVIKHRDTPLDVKIQCAGLLRGQEAAQEASQNYIAKMPIELPAAQVWQFGGACLVMCPRAKIPIGTTPLKPSWRKSPPWLPTLSRRTRAMSNTGFRLVVDRRGDQFFWMITEAGEVHRGLRGFGTMMEAAEEARVFHNEIELSRARAQRKSA
jgi:hypothetical protein